RRPELLEAFERVGYRLAGGALLSLATADDSEREQPAGAAEGVPGRFVLRSSVREERCGLGDVAAGGGDEAAAARHVRDRAVVAHLAFVLPGVEDSHRFVDAVEREQR